MDMRMSPKGNVRRLPNSRRLPAELRTTTSKKTTTREPGFFLNRSKEAPRDAMAPASFLAMNQGEKPHTSSTTKPGSTNKRKPMNAHKPMTKEATNDGPNSCIPA